MSVATGMYDSIKRSSWIRKMFNEGNNLKEKYGKNKIFDFSLGNPKIPPPEKFYNSLRKVLDDVEFGDNKHSYMPQSGYSDTCSSVANYISKEQNVSVSGREIIMTCGASGALNIFFKSILDPGDEVIAFMPYFVEYKSYVDNHRGILKMVRTEDNFDINFRLLNDEINEKTKAVIINSPNNPTGHIYSKEIIETLAALLIKKSNTYGKTIYLVSDEPYRKIVFDGFKVPSVFENYKDSVIATSYSKDISIPGERIGFAVVNPHARYKDDLIEAMALANRILGFVNAPALMQRTISDVQGLSVNIDDYRRKRDLLCDGLASAGYHFTKPKGTFYLFPRSPVKNDIDFVSALQKELILVVPGSGFEGPGYFRIAFCVDDETIIGAMPGFKKVMRYFK